MIVTETTVHNSTVQPAPAVTCVGINPVELARKDDEVLLQLVESSLFMRGEAISEGEIADTLGIPVPAIREALHALSSRYASYAGAIRVREIDDGLWLMDLHEEVAEHVDTFYLEDRPYTRSEIMTLAFIAFAQPVPKQVLTFYRGSNATSHARKLVDAGFVTEETTKRCDPRMEAVLSKYRQDEAERHADPGQPSSTDGEKDVKNMPREGWINKLEIPCYKTTNRFCGYFNLPRDLDSMKKELENWKEIYGLFD